MKEQAKEYLEKKMEELGEDYKDLEFIEGNFAYVITRKAEIEQEQDILETLMKGLKAL